MAQMYLQMKISEAQESLSSSGIQIGYVTHKPICELHTTSSAIGIRQIFYGIVSQEAFCYIDSHFRFHLLAHRRENMRYYYHLLSSKFLDHLLLFSNSELKSSRDCTSMVSCRTLAGIRRNHQCVVRENVRVYP